MSGKKRNSRLEELLALREYYNNHPEEAKEIFYKRIDDYVPIGTKPVEKGKPDKNCKK